MSQKIISSEQEVRKFLKKLKELLTDPRFDVSRDLDILLKKKSESPIDPYTRYFVFLFILPDFLFRKTYLINNTG